VNEPVTNGFRFPFFLGKELDYDQYDVHVVASAFKKWLREQEPLLSFALYQRFLQLEGTHATMIVLEWPRDRRIDPLTLLQSDSCDGMTAIHVIVSIALLA